MTPINDPSTKPRGLAALSPERRREISAKGGKAAHAQGKAHRFTSQEAKSAGQRGGKASSRKCKEER
jgi:general stress protein YciG